MAVKARTFEFEAGIDRAGNATRETVAPLGLGPDWKPEHLVLAALVRCSITSLRYHALRAGITVHASGSARGVITKRESDGRYAFVEIECAIEIALDPALAGPDLDALLEKAERDCFVGASLTVRPSYDWQVGA
jgi:organic hydroperoxide reductase OsmC/OhrA